jgi:hypothetical protein
VRRTWLFALALCWTIGALCSDARGAERKLLIVVIDKITWHDLLDDDVEIPVLRDLAETGAVGMMCVRTGRAGGGGYLTVGAGSRASAWARATRQHPEGYAFQATEKEDDVPADRAFTLYTGWPVGDNAIVHLGIGELRRLNADAPYPLELGMLGGTLRRSGLRVACVGNADTPDALHREAVCIAMDEQGMVELGDVSAGLLQKSDALPYRTTTDPERFLAAFHRVAAAADLVVLDPGDTSRVEEYSQVMTSTAARPARMRAIEKADQLLARVLERLPPEDWGVLIITPNIREPEPGETFAALTPVIFFRPGEEPGLLTSPSTGVGDSKRHVSLVLNSDIAPTVLRYFGIEPPSDVIGQPMMSQAVGQGRLARLERQVARQDTAELTRRWLFRSFPVVATVTLWLAAFLLAAGERAPRWTRTAVRGLLLLALSAPAAMLLVALRPLSPIHTIAAVIVGSVVVAAAGGWITGWRSGHVLPAVLLVGLLVYDLARGQALLAWSPFSYSAAAGARFYGIGNEYGGALLGAVLVSASGLLSRRARAPVGERPAAALVLAGLVAVVGSPTWGANLGMALGCAVGFGVFALYLWRPRPTGRDVAAVVALALAVAAIAIALGVLVHGPGASHIGRWVSRLQSHGWVAVGEVAVRKLSMNWLLLRGSQWTGIVAAALGALAVAALVRPRALLSQLPDRPWLVPAVAGCLAGAVASLLLNDSGIISAALALVYGAGSLAYVGLGEVIADA